MQFELGQVKDQLDTLLDKYNLLIQKHTQASAQHGRGSSEEVKARSAKESAERQELGLLYKEQKIHGDITKELNKQNQSAFGMFSSANKFHEGLSKSAKEMNSVFSV